MSQYGKSEKLFAKTDNIQDISQKFALEQKFNQGQLFALTLQTRLIVSRGITNNKKILIA